MWRVGSIALAAAGWLFVAVPQSPVPATVIWDLDPTHAGATFELEIDGATIQPCGTLTETATDRRCTTTLPLGTHTYRLRGTNSDGVGGWSQPFTDAVTETAPGQFTVTAKHVTDPDEEPDPLAFPQIASATSQEFSGGTSHEVTMPATVNAGDLLLVFVNVYGGNASSMDPPTDWDELFERNTTNRVKLAVFYKIADGTEDASTVDFATSVAQQLFAHIYRITSWHGTTPPEASAAATGNSQAPDATSLAPSWGAADTLWIAAFAQQFYGGAEPTPPSDYTGRTFGRSSTGGNTVGGATASRELNASSNDPGAFASATNDDWNAAVVAIRPSAAAPVSAPFFARTRFYSGKRVM